MIHDLSLVTVSLCKFMSNVFCLLGSCKFVPLCDFMRTLFWFDLEFYTFKIITLYCQLLLLQGTEKATVSTLNWNDPEMHKNVQYCTHKSSSYRVW